MLLFLAPNPTYSFRWIRICLGVKINSAKEERHEQCEKDD